MHKTTYSIVYYAPDSLVNTAQTDSLLKRFDQSVSLYQPNSLICQFNRSAKGIRIDEIFRVLITPCTTDQPRNRGAG
ncbi:hypothetical protein ACFJIV_15970 [Mucilaginibacter sp. UC70_90]